MALITKQLLNNTKVLESTIEDIGIVEKTIPISLDIKEIDFLLRKFSELSLSTKELQVGYNVMLKLQELQKRIMESKIDIG